MLRLLVAMLFAALCAASSAAEQYPSQPINLVVAFPPGGVADQVGRPAARALQKILKQPVVVINKPGAGGAIGNANVANAKPDGYTLLMALSSISTNPESERVAGRTPPFELTQFTPIALVTADPTVFVVKADSPYRSMKDVVEDAKKRPGDITYASSGVYGTYHVATEMFSHTAGIKMRHVPYGGGGPVLTAALGGQVELAMLGPSIAVAHVKAGKLRPLATLGGKRVEPMPDVPTLKELGYDVEYYIWSGLMAPAGTPDAVIKTLREAMAKAVEDPEFKETMAKLETPIAYMDAPQFKKYFEDDAQRLIAVVRKIGKIE